MTDGLQPGQTLTIPGKGSVAKPAATSEKKKEKGAEKYVFHDVQPKETKFGIAKQYGISVEELEKKILKLFQVYQSDID